MIRRIDPDPGAASSLLRGGIAEERVAADEPSAGSSAGLGPGSSPSHGPSSTGPPSNGTGASPPFHPHLSAYSGPLDLLLYLIQRNEVDIFDIPIARILEQYLEHVSRWQVEGELELAEAGAFLVMASRLMEIKSRLLLPVPEDENGEELLEEEVEDPRLSLVEQLLAYKEIKERAVLLEERHRERQSRYSRPAVVGSSTEDEDTLELGDASIWDLCSVFEDVLRELENRRSGVRVIEVDDIPVEELVQRISTRLEGRRESITFRGLFRQMFTDSEATTGALISFFLALLEMARLRLLKLAQSDEASEIELRLVEASSESARD